MPSKKPPSAPSGKQQNSASASARRTPAKSASPLSPSALVVKSVSPSAPPSSGSQKHGSRRQRLEAELQRAKSQRQNQKRKGRRDTHPGLWLSLGGTIAAVVGVIFLFILLGHQTANTSGAYPVTAADPTVVQQVTTVNPSVLAAVGAGQTQTKPTRLSGGSPLIGASGKPEVFFYGAEYCPYCAAERWSLIVALSRFGTFSHLSQTTSSSTDVYPSTHTFSFYHSSYTSQYLDFVPLEVQSAQGVSLETPTAAEQQLVNQYNPDGSFPFIDIANRYTNIGASYDPQVLSNLGWQEIASALSNANSPVAQSILGTANYLTAAICEATNQQPASVCQAAPIPQIQQALSSSTGDLGTLGSRATAPAAFFRAQLFSGGRV